MTDTDQREPIVEAERTPDFLMRRVRMLLDKAEVIGNMPKAEVTPELLREAEALNTRAAELLAKYGIDRAMLVADGKHGTDEVIDRVMWAARPFAAEVQSLLYNIVIALGGSARSIKQWDAQAGPKRKGGVPAGGWKYGLRVFAHESTLSRVEILYTSCRNQALAGAKKIVNTTETFGQAQKADRESYLQGFRSAVYTRLAKAEREAREARDAADQEARDLAMLRGEFTAAGPTTTLVLADRRKQIQIAIDKADGITQADRARWAAQDAEAAPKRQAAREAREKEIAECKRCQKAKTGRCNEHRERSYGRSYRAYERTGTQFEAGWQDGQRADLGTSDTISNDERIELS